MNAHNLSGRLHAAMSRPDFYPAPCTRVTYQETHISRLYFTEREVYKVKKPVDYGFLDFTSLEKRRYFCTEELRLNRRLARGMYREVLPISLENGRFVLAGDGNPIEWVVRMKRLPRERMLDYQLEHSSTSLPQEMQRVAEHLARFHLSARIIEEAADSLYLERVHRNWEENLDQSQAFLQDTLAPAALVETAAYVVQSLGSQGLAPLLQERQRRGLVRDGHGDLHSAHICLTHPLRIYDCIEFNQRFRQEDVLSDLAFLIMDLDYHGRRDLSGLLLKTYLSCFPGAEGPSELLKLYLTYRAWVRGKVDSLLARSAETPHETIVDARARAQKHFSLALGYQLPPFLILTCGLMGTGKSTVAAALSRATGALHLRSDVLRKEMAGLPPETTVTEDFGCGLYAQGMSRKTYDRLYELTRQELQENASVIADATFLARDERLRFLAAARNLKARSLLVYCTCPQEQVLLRLASRHRAGKDASDGRPGLFRQQALRFEPPTTKERALEVDTTGDVDYNSQLILGHLLGAVRSLEAV